MTIPNLSMDAIHQPTQMFDTIGLGVFLIMVAIIGAVIIIIIYNLLKGR